MTAAEAASERSYENYHLDTTDRIITRRPPRRRNYIVTFSAHTRILKHHST